MSEKAKMPDDSLPPADVSAEAQSRLLNAIDIKIGEVRTEAIDLSFGEIINLQKQNEIRIDPEISTLISLV